MCVSSGGGGRRPFVAAPGGERVEDARDSGGNEKGLMYILPSLPPPPLLQVNPVAA